MTSLYDCLGTLATTTSLSNYCQQVVQILSKRWSTFSDEDRHLLALIECFENCVRSIGPSIGAVIEPVFMRCVKLIEMHKENDSDFVQRAANLIAAIVTTVKEQSIPFINKSGLVTQMIQILHGKSINKS